MAWGRKNWVVRIDEIVSTIHDRAAAVQPITVVTGGIRNRLAELGEAQAKAISESLHLSGGGTKQERDIFRAMGLIERLCFNAPRPVEFLRHHYGLNATLSDLQGTLDLFIAAAAAANCRPADGAYLGGSSARVADMLLDGGAAGATTLLCSMCHTTVSTLVEFGSMGIWRKSLNNATVTQDFLGGDVQPFRVSDVHVIPRDNVVLFYKPDVHRTDPPAFVYSHVVLSLGEGRCAGCNHTTIGGSPEFSEIDLHALILRDGNGLHLRIDPLREVRVYARPVMDLLAYSPPAG